MSNPEAITDAMRPQGGFVPTTDITLRDAVLRSLDRHDQLLLVLWYAEGMTPSEIAEVVGATEAVVLQAHERIVGALQRSIAA
ncbi:MAG: hypothetical protein RIB32_03200 [Phycisphaerales bacterium]